MSFNRSDLREGKAYAAIVGALLLATVRDPGSPAAAELRRRVGLLPLAIDAWLADTSDRTELLACFRAAGQAGATAVAMNAVRSAVQATAGSGLVTAMRTASVRYALAQMARALAATEFTSRSDVAAAQALVDQAFADAEEYTSGSLDFDASRALIAMHAAVTRDLSVRGRSLPRVVTYSLGRSLPAIVVAQRLYADAARGDDIGRENKVLHPLFMPMSITALSS